MEITKRSKLTEQQYNSLKTISSLIETSVLSSFPHMPKGLFRTAKYELRFKGKACIVNVSFITVRYCPPISVELQNDSTSRPTMVAEGQVSYLDLDGAKLIREATKLSKGFWSSTLDSSVPFVGLSFFDEAGAVSIYHQKDYTTINGKQDYFLFEELATNIY